MMLSVPMRTFSSLDSNDLSKNWTTWSAKERAGISKGDCRVTFPGKKRKRKKKRGRRNIWALLRISKQRRSSLKFFIALGLLGLKSGAETIILYKLFMRTCRTGSSTREPSRTAALRTLLSPYRFSQEENKRRRIRLTFFHDPFSNGWQYETWVMGRWFFSLWYMPSTMLMIFGSSFSNKSRCMVSDMNPMACTIASLNYLRIE